MRAFIIKSQRGSLLFTFTAMVMFIGVFGVTIATLTVAENRMQIVNSEGQKGFYAAQSGLEYGIKRILAGDTLNNWTENNLDSGDGMTSDVEVTLLGTDSLLIRAFGKSSYNAKTLETTVILNDASKYAVYGEDSIEVVVTRDSLPGPDNPNLRYQFAPVMPEFDVNELRAIAQNNGYYYSNDLIVDASFSPPSGTIVFVEGELKFVEGNWENEIHFVSMGDVVLSSSFQNSPNMYMSIYQANPYKSVHLEQSQEAGENVDFDIIDGNVIPTETFAARATVLGAAISYNGEYDVPVTVKFNLGPQSYTPFGNFNLAVSGNVNDDENPRSYIFPNMFPAGTPISSIGRSWVKKQPSYSGSQNWHWMNFLTIDSDLNSPNVMVMRDGDPVPDIPGFMNQASIEEFVEPYIDMLSNTFSLDDNQAIYLFELGTTDLSSPAADFQDLVVLISLAKDLDGFIDPPGGGSGIVSFRGGIISRGAINGFIPGGGEGEDLQLEVIHDKQLLKDFFRYTINGKSRLLWSAKWQSSN